jgi:hypothetical protein
MTSPSFMTSAPSNKGNPTDLPGSYTPFHELDLCSNVFTDVKVPILFRNIPVLLIGRGAVPAVWLAARADAEGTRWSFIVDKSVSRHPSVKVDVDVESYEVVVLIAGNQILRTRCVSQEKAAVTDIDLRPLGLGVEGSAVGLKIGGTTLSGNRVSGLYSAITLS